MENITLDNGLLENLDVTFENELDVIVEYTFRNNKRPIDDTVREEAINDGSASTALRLDDHQMHQHEKKKNL